MQRALVGPRAARRPRSSSAPRRPCPSLAMRPLATCAPALALGHVPPMLVLSPTLAGHGHSLSAAHARHTDHPARRAAASLSITPTTWFAAPRRLFPASPSQLRKSWGAAKMLAGPSKKELLSQLRKLSVPAKMVPAKSLTGCSSVLCWLQHLARRRVDNTSL